ncbi:hypothetical protein [Streptomyces triculaminicus]
MDLFGLDDWVMELGEDNREGWEPLCTVISRANTTTRFRLGLIKAAERP